MQKCMYTCMQYMSGCSLTTLSPSVEWMKEPRMYVCTYDIASWTGVSAIRICKHVCTHMSHRNLNDADLWSPTTLIHRTYRCSLNPLTNGISDMGNYCKAR